MEPPQGDLPRDLDGIRAWLVELEQRVAAIEREAENVRRKRMRSVFFLILAGAIYAAFLWWESSLL